MKKSKIYKTIACPACLGELVLINDSLECGGCNIKYPVYEGVPLLIDEASKASNYVAHYQKDAESVDYFRPKDPQVTHDTRRIEEYVASYINDGSNTLLDVGAGRSWVARRFSRNDVIVSLDISPVNIKKALQVVAEDNHYGIVADANRLPFPDQTFDYVISTEVIEHVDQPKRFLESLFRVVKPGGKLLITTMYKEKIKYTLCVHCNQLTPYNAHLHSFDENSLGQLLADEGFTYDYHTFGNKILTRLRTQWFMRYLPFGLWKISDRLVNAMIKKPERIICVFTKKQNKKT
jgi:ubiquinone/menaquinone biosynthesis C-methylase UbiE/uncharacterized protein YbaR (Trm112 family)